MTADAGCPRVRAALTCTFAHTVRRARDHGLTLLNGEGGFVLPTVT